jgi:hypothetical protein
MMAARSRLLLFLAGLLVVVGLPLAGKWARRGAGPRCELDGLTIEPLYRVRVVDRAGGSHPFCCARCAARWLARQGDRPQAVYVTDEAGGAEVDSRSAFFVRSTVVTNPLTRNRVHAFRDRADAEAHVRAYGGEALTGVERPFSFELDPYRPEAPAPGQDKPEAPARGNLPRGGACPSLALRACVGLWRAVSSPGR